MAIEIERTRISAVVRAPFLHDLKGALGVVRLAAQLLEQKYPEEPTLVRLENGLRRLTTHFRELDGFMKLLEGVAVVAEARSLEPELVRLFAAFRLEHPGRQWSLDVAPEFRAPFDDATLEMIVRGLVDVTLKTSAPDAAISLSARDILRVSARSARPTPGIEHQLDLPVSEWTLGEARDVPFRLLVAAEAARAFAHEVRIRFGEDGIVAELGGPKDSGI